jgi:hypothetical protein
MIATERHAGRGTQPRPLWAGMLAPSEHAVLSLVACHHKSYREVAALLGTEPEQIRVRTHDALGVLVGWTQAGGLDGDLMDAALGQLTSTSQAVVKVRLRDSEIHHQLDLRVRAAVEELRPQQPGAQVMPIIAPVPGGGRSLTRAGDRTVRRTRPGLGERARVAATLSLGLSSIAAGAVLFFNGAHWS